MANNLTIRKLIERIEAGDIRIPAFQRDYVWESDQVAFLLDSIYKGFPIGTIILWKTDVRLSTEKSLGHYTLPEPQKDYPVNYVLDGQQRITSLFSAFQTELEPNSDDWLDVYFDMKAEENNQESLFAALSPVEVDEERYFPVSIIFDSVAYRKHTANLDDETVKRVDDLLRKFQEYVIPNETFESEDRNKVAIVFERINRAGTELNVFELLSAWSWSDDFDLTQKFESLQDLIAEHGYQDLCNDKDLQLKICAGVIRGRTTPSEIMDLHGDEIRDNFDRVRKGIVGAIDFLKRELSVKHYKMLPYSAIMVPLSAYFATDGKDGVNYSIKQKKNILKWFWRTAFSRRYTSDVNERQAFDISELLKLRNDENYEINLPARDVRYEFGTTNFSAANANSKTTILLLSSTEPQSFLSGAKIDTDKILKKGSKHEFHHIFPKAFLEKHGLERRQINCLANICFLTRADNNKIRDKSPAVYAKMINSTDRDKLLKSALCPADLGEYEADGFEMFIADRSNLLHGRALELMDGL